MKTAIPKAPETKTTVAQNVACFLFQNIGWSNLILAGMVRLVYSGLIPRSVDQVEFLGVGVLRSMCGMLESHWKLVPAFDLLFFWVGLNPNCDHSEITPGWLRDHTGCPGSNLLCLDARHML